MRIGWSTRGSQRYCTLLALAGAALLTVSAWGTPQDTATGGATKPSAVVQPAIGELRGTLTGLRIQKWKAPGAVKDDVQQNIGKIQLDLDSTLPPLLAGADTAPGSVANAFALYRNLDALYEVLLRVSGTADLAAPEAEAAAISHALGTLGESRRTLAESIVSTSHAQEAQLAQARQAPAAAPAPPPATTVVNDGAPATATRKKPKPKPKPPVAAPQP